MPKNIVLCFDGTKENFGPQPYTNVLKIYRLLDTTNQVCYYQPGVGTAATFDSIDDLQRYLTLSTLKNTMDAMFAFCLDNHITSAYLYLMHHYKPGDNIYMFGFSRGAFIGRVLAGMIERVGLLNEGLDDMVGMAWRIYESWEYAEQPSPTSYTTTLIQEFKLIFSRDYEIKIHFQGFFDSVNSVGFFRERLFPCTQRSNIVQHVRHALSIDERRGKFKQVCFTPNPYRPEMFSLRNKTFPKKENDMIYSVYSTLSTNRSETNTDIKRSPLFEGNLYNPIIDYTIHRYIGLARGSSRCEISSVSVLGRGIMKPKLERHELSHTTSDHLIRKVDSFLEISNPHANSYTYCSKDNVEGTFKLNRSMSYSMSDLASFDETAASLTSTQTLTPDLQEKWFPGDHCDIGGGWIPDCRSHNFLSNVSLRWMLAEAIKNGVKFKPGVIGKFAKKYTSLGSMCCSAHDYLNFEPCKYCKTGQEHHIIQPELLINNLHINHNFVQLQSDGSFDDVDLFRPPEQQDNEVTVTTSSMLSVRNVFNSNCTHIRKLLAVFWWLVELLPIGLKIESQDGKWRNIYIPNLGRPRCIPCYADMHWSVYWRLKFHNDYRPINLPPYVYEIMNHKTLNSSNSIVRFQLKWGSSINGQDTRDEESTSMNFCNMSPGSSNNSALSEVEIFNMLGDINYHQAVDNISRWEKDNWLTIPDDLSDLLEDDPDL
ncbi:similar to Saccharomyces cerevisiae YEL023C Putative protein of unknown function [Maudiozyma saulgeensis]|uniref:T6SS Phospholipase effector Tle1-like catalytic domain-containing protein n=1 Tax=Maudiozyma saulgeensis TaxID=1789683 RepID=A0A1X7R664_9SACH|nr:similar to Saccharomyces cerevisiae YEL023C Putative protein of unknown function [Kazachstania saulgeensis]